MFAPDSIARAAVSTPPPGADRDTIYGWLAGLDPALYPRLVMVDPGALGRLQWVDLASTAAFWQQDGQPVEAALSGAMSGLFGALCRLNTPFVIVASNTTAGFAYSIGTTDASRCASLMRTQLPGVRVVERLDITPHVAQASAWPVHAVLAGRPDPLPAPGPQPPLLERLASGSCRDWSLVTVVIPADAPTLRHRHQLVASLLAATASNPSATYTMRTGTTATITDAIAEHLADLLSAELDLCHQAVINGGVVVIFWVAARSTESAAAAAVVIGAAAHTTSATPAATSPDLRSPLTPIPLRPLPVGNDGVFPSSLIPISRLAWLVQPPCHDVAGLPCTPFARFDQHVPSVAVGTRHLSWGRTIGGFPVRQPVDELTKHVVITGRTGAGKTSTILQLVHQLDALEVPVLVIEPTKDDLVRGVDPAAAIWKIGDPSSPVQWKLNLLQVPRGTNVETHIDALSALFAGTLGLFNPLPFIVDLGLRRAYEARGWDLTTQQHPQANTPGALVWPTLSDVLVHAMQVVTDCGYVGEVHDDLVAALRSRLGSLIDGTKGHMLDTDDGIGIDELLDRTVVVNTHAVGDDDQKAFIATAVLLLVTEHVSTRPSRHLEHLVVIDEAHRVFSAQPRTAANATDGAADPRAKATEIVARCLAELRAYGVGVCVADQSIATIDRSATVNCATKVALATSDGTDKDVQINAMGLTADQAELLTSLPDGRAAMLLPGGDRAVLVDLALRHPSAAASPTVRFKEPARLTTPATEALCNQVIRTTGDDAARARAALQATIAFGLGPAVDPADLDEAVRAHLRATIDQLGRTRRWTHDQRLGALEAALSGTDCDEHPVRLLRNGSWPAKTCRLVCPHGGCVVGELTARPAAQLAADPLFDLARVYPPEGRARLHDHVVHTVDELLRPHPPNRQLAGLYDNASPAALIDLTGRCLVSRAYHRHADTIPDLLEHLPTTTTTITFKEP